MAGNPIDEEIEADIQSSLELGGGEISAISRSYDSESDRLLGFLLNLDYEELKIVTCDPWKRKCGGVPRNSFVIVKLSARQVDFEDRGFCSRLILARVTNSVPTPVETDIQGTIFQIHKVQAILDPVTQKDLQWSALQAKVVGTYFDSTDDVLSEGFGNDVDTFFSPHAYEVYVPSEDHLSQLINYFVKTKSPLKIGKLRYTETPRPSESLNVDICVDPKDFIGKDYGHRTALFGKTRFGKSNTIKVIADTIMTSDIHAGQVIFDPSGEYTYWNRQDNTSLYALHKENCIRYSLNPRAIESETKLGFSIPEALKVNFFEAVQVGHSLISQLFDSEFSNRPNYMVPILNWSPPDPSDAPIYQVNNPSPFNHFWRTMSLWFALLKFSGYAHSDKPVPVNFKKNVKDLLVLEMSNLSLDDEGKFSTRQPLSMLPAIYRRVAQLWNEHGSHRDWFPNSSSDGSEYFNSLEKEMLKILLDDGSISGRIYLSPFARYHDESGSDVFSDISDQAQRGKTVFVDFAKADENVRANLSRRICRKIMSDMMTLFGEDKLGNNFIVLYFEEAHTLFRKDDKDLNDIYNKIAKEGAKFNISMIYATQSMTTLSPDLLKNTENFIIAHLDDDREVKEVTRKFAFKDVADDLQRIMSKGFVRMITLSHKYALPVQIKKFEPPQS